MPIRRVCKGCLGKKHTSNVFLGEAFFQITLSRVVSRRLFSKSPLRALFFGGFFPNHPFARCFWEVFSQTTPSRVVSRRFFFKSPLRALFLGVFFSKSPFRALFFGGFSSNHPFARCFWEAFFQTTPSRVVFRRFFFKNSIPMCLEMLFSLGGSSFGCKKRQGSPRLILLVWSFSKLRVSAFQPCSALSHSHH